MLKTLYVADGNVTDLHLMEEAFKNDYRIFSAMSGSNLFSLLTKALPDMILLSAELPDMSGAEALSQLKEHDIYAQIPVIFLTDRPGITSEVFCLMNGAVDYISKPVPKIVLQCRIQALFRFAESLLSRAANIQNLQSNIVSILADIISHRDHETGGHALRTSAYIKILLDEMRRMGLYEDNISRWKSETIIMSARLHDVGKIVISDAILNKRGRLSNEEFALIKTHTTTGEDIIDRMAAQAGGGAFLSHAKVFAGTHHERWNGAGYPHGTKGGDIPLEGRILAIADVYDALVSVRPYKDAISHAEALKIILSEAGKHFDPNITEVFARVHEQFHAAFHLDNPAEQGLIHIVR